MSLRLRLTLLYTSLLGGTMLLVSALVYGLVNVILLDQVDRTLAQNSTAIISRLRMNTASTFDPRGLIDLRTTETVEFQVWSTDRKLLLALPPTQRDPLDNAGRWADEPRYQTIRQSGKSLRVLSIPLKTIRGPVGVLQIGQNITLVDMILSTLSLILVLLLALGVIFSGLSAWLVIGQTLAPLATVTRVAAQITRADDLQRRIPMTGVGDDEVGDLITSFNQVLERLEKLFTSQRRFLADVSHELRTPLTVIRGNVGLMRRMKELDEESLTGIESEVDRLTRLVGDLLILAQAESGRLPLNLMPVSLDTILLEVFQQMRTIAGDRVNLRIAEIDQVEIIADFDRIKQVLLNLGGNAIQYTPNGGEIVLSLRKSDQMAQILVTDTGPGIPAADLPHIFERFYRAEKSRTSGSGTGFGLGLSIANWITRSHGGRIEVSSREGQGTTFCVWLPLGGPPTPTA